MNRSTARTKVVVWSLVALLAIAGIFCGVFASHIHFTNGIFSSLEERNFRVQRDITIDDNATSLLLDWKIGEVEILKSTDGKVRIVQKATRDLPEDERFRFDVTGGKLTIEDQLKSTRLWIGSWNTQVRLELYLPEKEYQQMELYSASGSMHGEGLKAQKLISRNTSGEMKLSGAFSELALDNTSGSTKCQTTTPAPLAAHNTSGSTRVSGPLTKLDLNNTSGQLTAQSTVSAPLNARTTSGEIRVEGSFSAIESSTASGSISITSSELPASLESKVSSGRLKVFLPKDERGFRLTLKKQSGGFHNEFGLSDENGVSSYGGGKGEYHITVQSGSAGLYELS